MTLVFLFLKEGCLCKLWKIKALKLSLGEHHVSLEKHFGAALYGWNACMKKWMFLSRMAPNKFLLRIHLISWPTTDLHSTMVKFRNLTLCGVRNWLLHSMETDPPVNYIAQWHISASCGAKVYSHVTC